MKANEMPEKIYIFDYNDAMVTPLEGDTVYVRKDAFIEKAWDWIEDNLLTINQQDNAIKIMNEFVKAMKK